MRDNEKRITVALDGTTYKRLKMLGVDLGLTNQDMAEAALKEYLARHDASA